MRRLALTIVLMATPLLADQAELIGKQSAKKAAALLAKQSELRLFCAPCGDTTWEKISIDRVRAANSNYENYWEVQVNGKSIDLAYTYFKSAERWQNLAIHLGLNVYGVPEFLTETVSATTEVNSADIANVVGNIAEYGELIPPPDYNSEKSYPVVVVLPYTGGTAKNFLEYYLFSSYNRSLSLQEKWKTTLTKYHPEQEERKSLSYFIFAPQGKGSSRDHTAEGFHNAILRYEKRIINGLEAAAKNYNLNLQKVVLAGHSLGGDLSWALALRNPQLFAGAFISGSRTSYHQYENLDALKKKKFRFFFSMGEKEKKVRLKGLSGTLSTLKEAGISYHYYRAPDVAHQPPVAAVVYKALQYPLFGHNFN